MIADLIETDRGKMRITWEKRPKKSRYRFPLSIGNSTEPIWTDKLGMYRFTGCGAYQTKEIY